MLNSCENKASKPQINQANVSHTQQALRSLIDSIH